MVNIGSISVKQPVIFSMSKTSEITLQSKLLSRTISHAKNTNKPFNFICISSVFVEEMHVVCDKLLAKSAEEKNVIDFHDIMFKFTMDSFVL
jgi:hypothetical protein